VTDEITSPLIDAGDPNDPAWQDEPWPHGERVNVGAYGGTSQASKNGNIADFDVNGQVDLDDFAVLAYAWMTPGPAREDLDGNGTVEIGDLVIFAEHWLGPVPPPIRQDLNGDGRVNLVDFARLQAAWLQTGENPADLTGDGIVDAADLADLATSWLWSDNP